MVNASPGFPPGLCCHNEDKTMPDAPNDPRRPAPAAPDVPTAGRRGAPAPATSGQATASGSMDAAHAALDDFHETHMRNSALSQRTDLYNEAQSHLRALRET